MKKVILILLVFFPSLGYTQNTSISISPYFFNYKNKSNSGLLDPFNRYAMSGTGILFQATFYSTEKIQVGTSYIYLPKQKDNSQNWTYYSHHFSGGFSYLFMTSSKRLSILPSIGFGPLIYYDRLKTRRKSTFTIFQMLYSLKMEMKITQKLGFQIAGNYSHNPWRDIFNGEAAIWYVRNVKGWGASAGLVYYFNIED